MNDSITNPSAPAPNRHEHFYPEPFYRDAGDAAVVVPDRLPRRSARRQRPIRIAVLTNLYPNSQQPRHGIFVEQRLRALVASGNGPVVDPALQVCARRMVPMQ